VNPYTLLALILFFGPLLVAYLLGSIPAGYLLARSQGINIRTKGSGNIGATNVWRVMGRKWGIVCFILDFLKGLIPSLIGGYLLHGRFGEFLGPDLRALYWLTVATFAIVGHVFPVWLKFKGGKGVATSFGALLGVYPVFTVAALAAFIVWAIALKLTRMVGISSVIAGLILALLVVLGALIPSVNAALFTRFSTAPTAGATPVHAIFACILALLVTYKHRANIARTFAGTEPRIGSRTPASTAADSSASHPT
jgi:glycerol-3-phosphate acyltransferase PlsY